METKTFIQTISETMEVANDFKNETIAAQTAMIAVFGPLTNKVIKMKQIQIANLDDIDSVEAVELEESKTFLSALRTKIMKTEADSFVKESAELSAYVSGIRTMLGLETIKNEDGTEDTVNTENLRATFKAYDKDMKDSLKRFEPLATEFLGLLTKHNEIAKSNSEIEQYKSALNSVATDALSNEIAEQFLTNTKGLSPLDIGKFFAGLRGMKAPKTEGSTGAVTRNVPEFYSYTINGITHKGSSHRKLLAEILGKNKVAKFTEGAIEWDGVNINIVGVSAKGDKLTKSAKDVHAAVNKKFKLGDCVVSYKDGSTATM